MTTDQRSGRDRRLDVRRAEDRCAQCDLYRQHENERSEDNQKEHETIWSELKGMRSCVMDSNKGFLPRWVFISFAGFLVSTVVLAGGFQWTELRRQGEKHTESMEKVSTVLTGVAQTQAVMMEKIVRLEHVVDDNRLDRITPK